MPSRVTLRRKSRASAAAAATAEEEGQQEQDSTVALGISPAAAEDEGEEGDESREELGAQESEVSMREPEASTSSPPRAKANFVLVMDNGQLALVPAGKAHAYRSLPKRGQKPEEDSGASTPVVKKKGPKSTLRTSEIPSPRIRVKPLKRGRGRPSKKERSRSRMLEFEFEEELDDDEDDDADGEDGEEDDLEEEGAATPAEEADVVAPEVDDDDLVPPALELNVYVQGKDYVLRNEELVLDTDEDGERKLDAKGNLLGEREFSFRTFSSPYREDKEIVYALSIDVARSMGYRDSLYFFRRNPLLIKLSCTDREKVMLIEQGRLSGQLRTRNVTMLVVRNIFKTHGAKSIKDGRFVVDDYYEREARESGKREGQLAQGAEEETQPARAVERRREAERERDRQRRRPDAYTFSTADMQGNAIYTTFGDAGLSPFERSKGWNARRVNLQRADIDEENWMMEMARSVRGMNREIMLSRKERLKAFGRPFEGLEGPGKDGDQALVVGDAGEPGAAKKEDSNGLPIGFFEPVTNMPHYSVATQPTRARLERASERPLLDGTLSGRNAVLGGAKVGSQGWGVASFDQLVELPAVAVGPVVLAAGSSAKDEE